ncbi:HpcH/HpaI aldolase/citrate lyase family protein [Halosegnis sp.]|uniref:HpcH/HpaI aldolase/citrate lyase family protein n=1 Tax=Halosegnis sp. TaxID=2864959 RepID=UPI0035D4CD3D
MARRSLLFAPGDEPELLYKTAETGADVVCFDLEDAVAPDAKAAAREAVNDVVTDMAFDPDAEVVVRVNPSPETAKTDVATALAGDARVDAVMAPKTDSPADVQTLADILAAHDHDLPVFALCESAAGVLEAQAIAAADPVDALVFGAEDLAADIGATRTAEGTEVLHAREHIVLAAAAAGVDAIDTLHTDIEDSEGLAEAARFGIELGFNGKICIHPAQVAVVNEAFTPDGERIEWARRVLDAAGEGGVVRVDGEMVDAPLVTQAERVRERARAAGVWSD